MSDHVGSNTSDLYFFFPLQRKKILINQSACRTFFPLCYYVLLSVSERCNFSHKIYSVHAVSIFCRWEDVKINFLGLLIFSFKGILPKLLFEGEVLIWFHVLVCEACEFWMSDIQAKNQSLWKRKAALAFWQTYWKNVEDKFISSSL